MRDIKNEIVKMLRDEVKPAVGCTEPVAVALACVKAKELLNEDVVTNEVLVSPNIYKNGMCVGIPGTDRLGLKISVAMGIVGGKSSDGLSVLEGLTEEEVRLAEKYMDENDINVLPLETEKKVYIEVILKGANNKVKVCIDEKHDNFVFIQSNEEILLNNIKEVYLNNNNINLLLSDRFYKDINKCHDSLIEICCNAMRNRVAVSSFVETLSYFDNICTDKTNANLLQGMRDYFGSHTYQRIDRKGVFHTKW